MFKDHSADALRCSFCGKSQDVVSKLLSCPSDHPRAYICDECVRVCASILEDEVEAAEAAGVSSDRSAEPHPLIHHVLASAFFESVERWIRRESLGADASAEFAEMRSLAIRMMSGKL